MDHRDDSQLLYLCENFQAKVPVVEALLEKFSDSSFIAPIVEYGNTSFFLNPDVTPTAAASFIVEPDARVTGIIYQFDLTTSDSCLRDISTLSGLQNLVSSRRIVLLFYLQRSSLSSLSFNVEARIQEILPSVNFRVVEFDFTDGNEVNEGFEWLLKKIIELRRKPH
jgi:hypothetical protein